jgi:putative spermidine/putrescine transport system substrate-binding protein
MSRRTLIAALAATFLAASAASAQAEELVFASWGGTYQDAIRKAWIEPFTQATGIEVIEDTEPEIAKIKAMVDTNSVSWDVVTGGGSTLMRGVAAGLFEEITPAMVKQDHVLPQARQAYAVPSEIFSTVIGFSTEAFPDGKPRPQSFADFWDVKKFPGKRALPDEPSTVLEIALLADGVPADKVYATLDTPEGMQRALDKIAEIKPYVGLWWSSGAQPVQALGSGEVTMAIGWNGRFQGGIDQNLPIAMSWGQSVAQVGYFMIVKGAPHKDAAIKFLNHIESPEAQAEFSKYVAYGPITDAAWPMIDDARKARLPSTPDRLKNSLFMDDAWWAKHATEATEKYTALLQG